MSKLVDVKIDCPACNSYEPFEFERPKVNQPVRAYFKCRHCNSEFMLDVHKPLVSRKTEVKITIHAKRLSPEVQKSLHVAHLGTIKPSGS